jgi:hypothetical protein
MIEINTMENLLRELPKDQPTLPEFATFIAFLTEYVSDHPDAIPFNLEKLSQAASLPLETIRDFFIVFGKAFALFNQLKTHQLTLPTAMERLEKKTRSSRKKSSKVQKTKHQDSKENTIEETSPNHDIPISIDILQHLADFYCISHLKPIHEMYLPDYFSVIIQKFPFFVQQTDQSWGVTQAGMQCAEEFLAFKKLNSIPREIKIDTYRFIVKELD